MSKKFKQQDFNPCNLNEKEKMNDMVSNYQFANAFSRGGCKDITDFTLDNNMMSQQTVGNADTCKLDKSNELRVGKDTLSDETENRRTRIFTGIPNLEKRKPNTDIESRMRQGYSSKLNIENTERANNRWKEPLMDCFYNKYMTSDMIPQDTRGGINTQKMMKENCFGKQ